MMVTERPEKWKWGAYGGIVEAGISPQRSSEAKGGGPYCDRRGGHLPQVVCPPFGPAPPLPIPDDARGVSGGDPDTRRASLGHGDQAMRHTHGGTRAGEGFLDISNAPQRGLYFPGKDYVSIISLVPEAISSHKPFWALS